MATNNQWIYKEGDAEVRALISGQNGEQEVFMVEDINPKSILELVKMWNSDYTIARIKSNLEQDDKLTGDEVDYIVEQIQLWEEKMVEPVQEEMVPWEELPEQIKISEEYKEGIDPYQQNENNGDTLIEVTVTKKEEKKERKPRTVKAVTTGTSKVVSPEDYIKSLQEKIELTKLLSEVVAPEIPEGLNKAGRDLMIKFSQDHNKLIVEYLEKIQAL